MIPKGWNAGWICSAANQRRHLVIWLISAGTKSSTVTSFGTSVFIFYFLLLLVWRHHTDSFIRLESLSRGCTGPRAAAVTVVLAINIWNHGRIQ